VGDRVLILSDLHIGDGTSMDDFLPNAELVLSVLERHYLERGFTLLLNGDIEELCRFPLQRILRHWARLYSLFERFAEREGLLRILGNHDRSLRGHRLWQERTPLHDALKLDFNGNTIFALHGCAASLLHRRHQWLSGLALRYLANPLGIRNYGVRYDSKRRFRLERKVYQFARDRRIVTIMGHTHRPLFESMSKVDSLKLRIEAMCRRYPLAGPAEQALLQLRIRECRADLQHTLAKDKTHGVRDSLYDVEPVVPCLFNSGCAVGKRGITGIEIANGNIALVHWFDVGRSSKYLDLNGVAPQRLEATDYHRVVLKEDSLDYVFARTLLLG
jgi:UDP-2,3-diacylglucosamine pyrophosphatase LpxH